MATEEIPQNIQRNISKFSVLLVTLGCFFIYTGTIQLTSALIIILLGLIVGFIDWIFNLRLKNSRTNLIKEKTSNKKEEPVGDRALPVDQSRNDRTQVDFEEISDSEPSKEVTNDS